MPDEFAKNSDLFKLEASLGDQMKQVLDELKRNTEIMHELKNSVDLLKATSQAENDRRYRLKTELVKDALAVLDEPCLIEKIKPIVIRIIDENTGKRRDGILSWLNLVKAIGGMVAAYAAYSIITNQSAIMQTLQTLK